MNYKISGTLRLGISTIYARYKLPNILKMFHGKGTRKLKLMYGLDGVEKSMNC